MTWLLLMAPSSGILGSVSPDLQCTWQALVNGQYVPLFAVTPCQAASHAHESFREYLKQRVKAQCLGCLQILYHYL